MKIEARIDRIVNRGNVKAIASVSLDGFYVVKNLKIMDGKKGLFVSMPQETYPGPDGKLKYSNIFFPVTNAAKSDLQTAVLQAYEQHLNPSLKPKARQEDPWQGYPEPSYPVWPGASDAMEQLDYPYGL